MGLLVVLMLQVEKTDLSSLKRGLILTGVLSSCRYDSLEVPMSKFSLYDLRVVVEEINGRSVCGMAVGDYFEVSESSKLRIPEGKHFCIFALNAILPLLPAKQRQLDANDWLETDTLVACPDPEEQVIMRIERIGHRELDRNDLT